jgi:hypothetical protein
MTRTALDVTTEALRMIEVTALDEDPSGADHERARAHLDAIYAELGETYGLAPEWTVDAVPDRLWLHMASAVAGSICTGYAKPQYVPLRAQGVRGVLRDEMGGEIHRPTEAQFF